jgi:hypothetical protein
MSGNNNTAEEDIKQKQRCVYTNEKGKMGRKSIPSKATPFLCCAAPGTASTTAGFSTTCPSLGEDGFLVSLVRESALIADARRALLV